MANKIPVLSVLSEDGKYYDVPAIRGKEGKTPVKGTDYWTEADKKEIIDETTNVVLSKLINLAEVGG